MNRERPRSKISLAPCTLACVYLHSNARKASRYFSSVLSGGYPKLSEFEHYALGSYARVAYTPFLALNTQHKHT